MSVGAQSVEIRHVQDDDREAVLGLLAAAMGWGNDARYARFFAWKHDANPYGRSPAWVAEHDGRLVGLRVWLRWSFERDGRAWSAVRAVDTATHPSARGQGIFTGLTMHGVHRLTDEGVDFVFNTPNEKSRPGYMKMGWRELGTLPTSVRFSGPVSLLRTIRARRPAEKWSLPTSVGIPAPDAFAGEGAHRWLEHRAPTDGRFRTALDPEVLRWRYGLADLHYRVITDKNDGCLVFRIRRRGPSTEAVVCLVLARDDRRKSRLLRRLARTGEADHVLELTTDPDVRAGFLPLPGQGPVMTWRQLAHEQAPSLADFDVSMGDVELF